MSTAIADQLELTFAEPAESRHEVVQLEPALEPSETGLPLTVYIHRALAHLETQALAPADHDTLRITRRTLTRHQPLWDAHLNAPAPTCAHCHQPDPCPHIITIAGALGL